MAAPLWVWCLLFYSLGTFMPVLGGDAVLESIEEARNAYQQENYKRAHVLLQNVPGNLQEKISTSLKL